MGNLPPAKGRESHTSCMPKITTEVKVKGDITDEQLETIQKLVRYSPVHGMVEYANTVASCQSPPATD